MPRVSVIMNVRNGAATLREALDSVVAQTFTDWEIILWDDRSADESASIVAEYQDLRIRYWLSPEYTSLGLARELAIREATGEWLAFLDQDDIWLPDKLQKQVALSEDGPLVGIIYGRTLAFSEWGFEFDYDHQHEFKPLPEGDIFLQLFTDTRLLEGYRSGRPARLSAAQHRRLGDILDSGPVAYGLDTGIWTSPMIAWVVEEEFGVVYHPGHVRKLLHDLGFSVQRPRRVLARADRHQQDRWHRYIYPRLKKKPAPRTGR